MWLQQTSIRLLHLPPRSTSPLDSTMSRVVCSVISPPCPAPSSRVTISKPHTRSDELTAAGVVQRTPAAAVPRSASVLSAALPKVFDMISILIRRTPDIVCHRALNQPICLSGDHIETYASASKCRRQLGAAQSVRLAGGHRGSPRLGAGLSFHEGPHRRCKRNLPDARASLRLNHLLHDKEPFWCPEGDLNPHAALAAADFKSAVSADSTIRASYTPGQTKRSFISVRRPPVHRSG